MVALLSYFQILVDVTSGVQSSGDAWGSVAILLLRKSNRFHDK